MSISPDRSIEASMEVIPHRRARTALALAVAALLALSAVACGSDDDATNGGPKAATTEQEPLDKNAYLNEVNGAQTDFASEAAKLNLANPSSPKGFKRSLDQLVGLIDTLTQRLDDVEPPESVTAQHDKLVTQLTAYGDTIEEQKGGLSSSNQKTVADSATKIGEASTSFSESFDGTIKQINGRLD